MPAKPLSFGLPLSTAVYDKDKRLLRLTLADDEQYRLWVPLSDISPQLVEAVLLHEDRHFYHHFAVNRWRFRGRCGPRMSAENVASVVRRFRCRWRG